VEVLRLTHLFSEPRPHGLRVATIGERAISFSHFAQAVAAVASLVETAGKGRWLLATDDAFEFAVGLFGLLRAGCTVAIPPNHLPATLARLCPEMAGTLSNRTPTGPISGTTVEWHGIPEAGNALPDSTPLEDLVIEFWTSGSSGEAKCIRKRLSQLDAEVQILEKTFGTRLREGPVFGTVPHQHIYGCIFRILWPLAAGRPFVAEQCVDPHRIQSFMARTPAATIISSPALLSRLPDLLHVEDAGPIAAMIFSSGGPLATRDATAWRRWVPDGITEVFGSTETGGIAWRIQSEDPDSAHWTPFPDVSLAFEADGALRIESFRAGSGPLRMEDAAETMPDGRFRLLGRLDRIVKLEEKRVSLPELEAALEEHPWVSHAAVTRLEAPRVSLGGVVVLNKDLRPLTPQEWRQLGQLLRQHLALRFEPAALPKRWRFVEELPYNERGKLTTQALAALFAQPGI